MAASAAPRGRKSGRGRVLNWLSSNGRPVALLSRHPDPAQAVLPVDAFSLAVACGSRGVSCDIWPASLRHPSRHALPGSSGTTGISPCPARHVAPRPGSAHAGMFFQPAQFPAPAAPGRRWYAPTRALPRAWRTVPLRCVDRLCCAAAAEALVRHSAVPSHAGVFVPATSLMATVIARHPITASSRQHQENS